MWGRGAEHPQRRLPPATPIPTWCSAWRAAAQARINGMTVQNMARARRGREICIGLVTDDPFGPVITFGAGGTMIELIDDRAMELPPLNQFWRAA
jgi:acyl-CoA synthetase (NDP forming)